VSIDGTTTFHEGRMSVKVDRKTARQQVTARILKQYACGYQACGSMLSTVVSTRKRAMGATYAAALRLRAADEVAATSRDINVEP
jgi:hypothetical protein